MCQRVRIENRVMPVRVLAEAGPLAPALRRMAALTLLRPGTWPAEPWPVALCSGGGEPSPAGMTMARTQSPDRDDQREA